MSKAEIQHAEEQAALLRERSRTTTFQVDKGKAQVYDAKRRRSMQVATIGEVKEETKQMIAAQSQTKKLLEERAAARDAVLKELAEAERELEAERQAIAAAKAAKKGLVLGQAALGDVHEELLALSSDEAKKATLETGGGELPTDLVPAPQQQSPELAVDQEALWNKDPAHPMRDEIRQAFQSGMVLVALQKSLSVRAAEIREGLRQLGFAHDATTRTQELCKVAEGDLSGNGSRAADFDKDRGDAAAERREELGNLEKLRAAHEAMQQRQVALQSETEEAEGAVANLRERCRAKRDEFETAKLEHEELVRAHDEAGREVEARQQALQEHPDEAARRVSAAERLARMAEEQTQRGLEELQQIQEQLIGYQYANRSLQQTYALLGEQLAAEKKAFKSLKAQHDCQDIELAALARNYMAALPPLPGLDKLLEEPAVPIGDSPAAAEAPSEEAEKAATGRTPEPAAAPRHLDPTGDGALSAGGRLVVAI